MVRMHCYRNGVFWLVDVDRQTASATPTIKSGRLGYYSHGGFVMSAFDSTLGGALATSYMSLADADALYASTLQENEWQSYSNANREAGLMHATTLLETLDWLGTRCNDPESTDDATLPQALRWPRTDVSCNGIAAVCEYIPNNILKAQAYLALQILKDPTLINRPPNTIPPGLYVKRNKLGDLEQEFGEYANTSYNNMIGSDAGVLKMFPWLADFVGCYLNSRGNRMLRGA